MKIQYCSDLHLEFPENRNFLKANPLLPKGDILLLAGDIVPFAIMEEQGDFFNLLSDNFETTYWIPGNHEYYHSDIADRSGTFNERIKDNLFLVNNISLIQSDVKFIFSTLWTRISPRNQFEIRQRLSDFHTIKFNNKGITTDQYNLLHDQSSTFLKEEFTKEGSDKKIIVTHHVPTFMNYPEQYRGDSLNEAFAVEMYNDIETSGADFWIFGHHHSNPGDFSIGKTRLLANQLGYVRYNENIGFDTGRVIEIN